VKPAKDLKTKLSLIDPEGKIHIEPLAILDRRIVKKKMHALVEVLVQSQYGKILKTCVSSFQYADLRTSMCLRKG
jgi:hypothetical protein